MRAVVVSAVLLASTMAQAEYLDGNKLHIFCAARGIRGNGMDEMTIGYVAGVVGGMETVGAGLPKPTRMHCIPQTVSPQQARDVVCQFVDKNPQSRHYHAAGQVFLALIEAWPCPKP